MVGESERSNQTGILTKSDLITEIVVVTEITRQRAHDILEIILETMVRALRAGETSRSATSAAFGSASVVPASGEILAPASG
jgi:Bacterial DNA-binding protein